MSINIDEYRKIKKGFRLEVYSVDIPFGNNLMEIVFEGKFKTLLDLISYIESIKDSLWISIHNSNKRITLFGGKVSYFKEQIKLY